MSKLEKKAREWVNKHYWGESERLLEVSNPEEEAIFAAGALWLLEEARNLQDGTSDRISVTELAEFCETKKDI